MSKRKVRPLGRLYRERAALLNDKFFSSEWTPEHQARLDELDALLDYLEGRSPHGRHLARMAWEARRLEGFARDLEDIVARVRDLTGEVD